MNIKRMLVMLVVAVSLGISGSSFAKKKPDWVEGNSKKYSSGEYFVGVGAVSLEKGGPKQRTQWVGDAARAELAKAIRSTVDVSTRTERNVESQKEGKKSRVDTNSRQGEVVSVSAGEFLEGVEIKEYYEDKKDKMYYALAVLNRHEAARRVESKLNDAKQAVLAEVEAGRAAQSEGRLLAAMKSFRSAKDKSANIANMCELLSVLKPSGAMGLGDCNLSTADIDAVSAELKKKIKFSVDVQGPALGIKPYLLRALSRDGFVLAESKDAKDGYVISGTTDLTYRGQMKMGNDLEVNIYQADVDIEVRDPANNGVIGTLTLSASANEKETEMASKSAVRALGRLIESQLSAKLGEIF